MGTGAQAFIQFLAAEMIIPCLLSAPIDSACSLRILYFVLKIRWSLFEILGVHLAALCPLHCFCTSMARLLRGLCMFATDSKPCVESLYRVLFFLHPIYSLSHRIVCTVGTLILPILSRSIWEKI